MRKTVLGASVLMALCAMGVVNADVIYDSTNAPRFNAPSDTTPLRYNNNSFGDITRILYDDVPVFAPAVVDPSVDVSSIRFDIVQKAGAPAVNVSGFWSPMVLDLANNGGPNDDPNSANSLGAPVALTANDMLTDRVVSITFNTPFNTGPLNVTESFGNPYYFMAGLAFDNTDGRNGWEVADNGTNLDVLWDYKNPSDLDEFTFGNDANGAPVFGVMAMRVEGTLVPEPALGGLLICAGATFLSRRSRKV
jgi:hypothetical protein